MSLLVVVLLEFNFIDIGLELLFSISMTYPLSPSKPFKKNECLLYLIREVNFELLKDFPLENKYIDSRSVVLPEPLAP